MLLLSVVYPYRQDNRINNRITNQQLLLLSRITACFFEVASRVPKIIFLYHIGYIWYTHTYIYAHIFKCLYCIIDIQSNQIRSVTQSCPTLCDPMNRSMPGLPVHHQLPEFTETHIHRVSDAIQPSHPCRPLLLLPPIPPSIRVFSNESTLRMRWPRHTITSHI